MKSAIVKKKERSRRQVCVKCPHCGRDHWVPDDVTGSCRLGKASRVRDAIFRAQLHHDTDRLLTDDDGPHAHHWEPILWWCRGCGECDPAS